MRKRREGYQCSVTGCRKRLKIDKSDVDDLEVSDIEEDPDDECLVKRFFPRTFHR